MAAATAVTPSAMRARRRAFMALMLEGGAAATTVRRLEGSPPAAYTLVAMLPSSAGGPKADEQPERASRLRPGPAGAPLRDLALAATDLAFTVSDPHQPGHPLVWVNPAFTRMTGYSQEESVGRNCRFLQGPDTDADSIGRLRAAISMSRPVTLTLLNYRRDGTTFWNEVAINPVFDAGGELLAFVGVQNDVSERVRLETERQQAYAAEQEARRDAETARRRLGVLAAASVQLAATLDLDETLARLTGLVVPALADWVIVTLVNAQGAIDRTLVTHRSAPDSMLSRVAALLPHSVTELSGTRRVLDGGGPVLLAGEEVGEWRAFLDSEELAGVIERLGVCSVMYVPLTARHRILGTLTLVSGSSGRQFGDEDLAVAADLGRRAGLTLDNARLYQREHRVAETLQRSLLPQLPPVAGLGVAARYLPGDDAAEVGGDFYELLPLPDGSVGFAAGDVVGHDLSAAAAMGHLRGLLRACAWQGAEDGRNDPGQVLDRLDRLVQGLDVVPLATLVYGRLDRPAQPGRPWRFTYANAGHPPPLLRAADGSVALLDAGGGVLLGVVEHSRRRSVTVEVPAGSTLVLYTDGLVERRGEDLDAGIARIGAALARVGSGRPEAVVDGLVATLGADRSDDTAVIAVHVPA